MSELHAPTGLPTVTEFIAQPWTPPLVAGDIQAKLFAAEELAADAARHVVASRGRPLYFGQAAA